MMEALELPSDTEAALAIVSRDAPAGARLRGCAASPVHALYAVVHEPTEVDQELERLRLEHTCRLLQVSTPYGDEQIVARASDYASAMRDCEDGGSLAAAALARCGGLEGGATTYSLLPTPYSLSYLVLILPASYFLLATGAPVSTLRGRSCKLPGCRARTGRVCTVLAGSSFPPTCIHTHMHTYTHACTCRARTSLRQACVHACIQVPCWLAVGQSERLVSRRGRHVAVGHRKYGGSRK